MERIKLKEKIKIERTLGERFVMAFRHFLEANKQKVIYSLVFLVLLVLIGLGVVVYVDSTNNKQLVSFENLIEDYNKIIESPEKDSEDNKEKIQETVASLKQLVEESRFGFLAEMGNYILGNIFFDTKNYNEAIISLLKFSENSQSTTFVPLALQKAALAREENKDLDGALELYKKLEENYLDSIIVDQIYYNLGRIYQQKKDTKEAKKYFDKVISLHAQSPLADQAKKRIFLLDWEEK